MTAEPDGAIGDVKAYSCLPCRQRKVKCDRQAPCSNCVKTERQCSFIAPVRGKRKRTKPPREGLHAKLRRYEELLKSYGAKLEPAESPDDIDGDVSDVEMASQLEPDALPERDLEIRSDNQNDPYGLEEHKPRLITNNGGSRYFDRCVFSDVQRP